MSEESNYVIWEYRPEKHACSLTRMEGLSDALPLLDGASVASAFPSDVVLSMDADRPHQNLLFDNVYNTESLIIVSRRLRDLVGALGVPSLDWLPVRIRDHKQRVLDDPYFIMHVVAPVDCLDRETSVFDYHPIARQMISDFKRIVLDESRIPAQRTIFRIPEFWRATFVARDVAASLARARVKGLQFIELEDWE